MAFTEVFAGIPTADYPTARLWYERLLGRAPDMLPHDTEAAWQITNTGWIYLVGDPDRSGRALVTFLVDDLETLVTEMAGRELPIGAIETIPGVVQTAAITDPEGNRITFAQPHRGDG